MTHIHNELSPGAFPAQLRLKQLDSSHFTVRRQALKAVSACPPESDRAPLTTTWPTRVISLAALFCLVERCLESISIICWSQHRTLPALEPSSYQAPWTIHHLLAFACELVAVDLQFAIACGWARKREISFQVRSVSREPITFSSLFVSLKVDQ